MADVEKVVKYRIEVDESGKELSRKPLGRGRPPKNAKHDKDGNLIVTVASEAKAETKVEAKAEKVEKTEKAEKAESAEAVKAEMITIDGDGKVLSRTPKGRGRPASGFEKQDSGPFAGHWLKVEATEAPVVKSIADVVASTA